MRTKAERVNRKAEHVNGDDRGDRANVRDFLERHGLRALRQLGQNYLVDASIAQRLVDLAGVEPGDTVIEIGTGLGKLTEALASRAGRVVTIEIDAGLVRALSSPGALPENVELLHANALKVDLREIVEREAGGGPVRMVANQREAEGGRVRVVANLPYSITGPLLRRLLDLRDVVADWSVMLQREVADRLCAEVGTKAYSSLTVLHRASVQCSRVLDLKPGCFHPVPRVHSSFLRMVPLAAPLVPADDAEAFAVLETFVRAAFAKRRKTLVNAVRSGLGTSGLDLETLEAELEKLELDPRIRAEAVTPEQFAALAHTLGSGWAA